MKRISSRLALLLICLSATSLLSAQGRTSSNVPVMFDNVRMWYRNGTVFLQWSNLTERELIDYVVERSADALTWKELSIQLPKSNKNEAQHYTDTDTKPMTGLSYYRIKVNERTGRKIYSNMMKLQTDAAPGMSIYPNPCTGGRFSWSANDLTSGNYTVSVISVSGCIVYSGRLKVGGDAITGIIELPASLPAGFYRLMLNGDAYVRGQSFILR